MLKLAGMSSNSTWRFCTKTNATYLDCPIADMDLTEGKEVFVGIHNPSSLNLEVSQLAVPNGHFNVSYWNYYVQEFF
jgi:hypothetical protein